MIVNIHLPLQVSLNSSVNKSEISNLLVATVTNANAKYTSGLISCLFIITDIHGLNVRRFIS